MLVRKIEEAVNKEIPRLSSQLEQIDYNKADKNMINTPLVANSTSEMFDKSKIYVNLSDGNWYYNSDNNWLVGGKYNSLSIADKSIKLNKNSNDINEIIETIVDFKQIDTTIQNGGKDIWGATRPDFTDWRYIEHECVEGEMYRATTTVNGSAVALVIFYNSEDKIISYLEKGGNSSKDYVDFMFVTPSNCTKFAINGYKDKIISISKLIKYEIKNEIKNIKSSLSKFVDIATSAIVKNGFYNGGSFSIDNGGKYKTYVIDCNTNDEFYVSGATENQYTQLITLLYNDTYVASYVKGTGTGENPTRHEDCYIKIPSGVNKLAIFNIETLGECVIKANSNELFKVQFELDSILNKIKSVNNLNYPLKDKKIVWFGTSIPAGGYIGLNNKKSYPMMVGEKLGAIVYNEAVGSSGICARRKSRISENNPYGFSSNFEQASRCLGNTIEEMQWIIDNWNSDIWKSNKLTSAPSEQLKQEILSFSFENKLIKNHLGNNRKDLYIIDHGHNDYWWENDAMTQPEDIYDRTTVLGSYNFIIKTILEDNPKARIIISGHYERQKNAGIVTLQQKVADYWELPLIPLWRMLGWSYKEINGKKILTTWMPDDTHPHSDTTGKATNLITEQLVVWFNSNCRVV